LVDRLVTLDPVERRLRDRLRATARRPFEVALVIGDLPVERRRAELRSFQKRKAERAIIEPMNARQGLDAAPPDRAAFGGRYLGHPAGGGVGLLIGTHACAPPGHC